MAVRIGMHITRRASFALAGGFALLRLVPPAFAGDEPSESQILNALKGRVSRSPAPADAARSADEQRFINALRGRPIRSITAEDRLKVATIVKDRPNIDLEINFEYNSAAMRPKAMPVAVNLGRALMRSELKDVVFLVAGHTDAKGGDDYNQQLSERRAETVRSFLVEKFRIPAANLVAVGFGKEQLKNTADPLAEENRRVQIINTEVK
jgi:outer membrane protein OmpA-like peptidoglycan-associated protein